jgi:hypothetical protein
MRALVAFAGMLLVSPPILLAQDGGTTREREVTIRGCVVPAENNTYVMTGVTQSPGPGGAVLPEIAHGRRVLFWLKNDDSVKNHPNQLVEVTGRFTGLKESEIELKAGRQDTGGLVVEIEGPGRNVVTSNREAVAAVGAAGRQTPEKNDIKTYLAEVRVTHVREVGGSCP